MMTTKNRSASIASETLRVESATHLLDDDVWFRVTWSVLDKNGKSGSIRVLHSLSPNPRPVFLQAGQEEQ